MLVNALGLFFVIRGKGTECVAVKILPQIHLAGC